MLAMLALGVLVFTRKRVTWGDGWMWPVPPILVGGVRYNPIVSDGWGMRSRGVQHTGLDIVYARRSRTDLVQRFPPGTPNGGASWFAPGPPGAKAPVPVLAARGGRIWEVKKTSRGWSVVLDHSKPFATFYQHLESVLVPNLRGQSVVAGQPLGFMGWSPEDAERVRHLHFEVHHEGSFDAAVDPQAAMASWSLAQPFDIG